MYFPNITMNDLVLVKGLICSLLSVVDRAMENVIQDGDLGNFVLILWLKSLLYNSTRSLWIK